MGRTMIKSPAETLRSKEWLETELGVVDAEATA
jgi:hypothetical protein